jgi:hypothetical protein
MFRVKIKLMETRPADVARDAWREIQKAGMVTVAEYWFKEMLPRHFTPQAKYIYNHKPRSKVHIERKKKWATYGNAIMGGVVDNVMTGKMMQALTTRSVIRGFPTRATIYLYGPPYLTIKFNRSTKKRDGSDNKPSQQPDKPREIFTKTPQELVELRQVLRRYISDRLTKYRSSRKTTTI